MELYELKNSLSCTIIMEIKFDISAEFYMVIRNISTKALIIGRLDMLLDTLNVTYCQKIYMNSVI